MPCVSHENPGMEDSLALGHIFTHVWNCHTVLLTLFLPLENSLTRVSFIWGCIDRPVCVSKSALSNQTTTKSCFCYQWDTPTSLLIIPSPQKENNEDVDWYVIDLSDIQNKQHQEQTSLFVFIMFCRSVYCTFHPISRQTVKYWYCSLETTDFTAACCFMQRQRRPCSWRGMLLHCAELIIPLTSVKDHPPSLPTHTHNSTVSLKSNNWLKVASPPIVLKATMKSCCCGAYSSEVKLPVA